MYIGLFQKLVEHPPKEDKIFPNIFYMELLRILKDKGLSFL